MKKILLNILFALITTLGFSQAPNYVPTNGLVGWWPFNGNAYDESGNGNNGTVNGATLTTDRNGVANQAYTFDLNQKIGTFITNFPVYSVSIWAKINTWNLGIGTGNGGTLASHKTDGLYGNGWVIEHNQDQYCWLEYNANNSIQQYSGNPQLNTWFHVVLTSDSQGTRKFYIDGVLTDTYNGAAIISGGNNYEFKIGAHIDGTTIWWFKGDLDDVGYWSRALTDCEIQNLYASTNPTNTTTVSTCDSYLWNGTTYNSSGVYSGQTANCVTESLDLTITLSSINTTTAAACNSFTWNGQTYTQSGVYTGTTANCVTETLDLTINSSTSSTQTQIALDTYTWPLNNQTYTQGGTYTATIPNAAGCDSVVTLNLTFNYTGINEPIGSAVSISPNPTTSKITVKSSLTLIGEKFTIYDQQGKAVKMGVITAEETEIDLSNLSEGVYLFKAGAEMQETFKIIKQ
jgi:hypothetical protein